MIKRSLLTITICFSTVIPALGQTANYLPNLSASTGNTQEKTAPVKTKVIPLSIQDITEIDAEQFAQSTPIETIITTTNITTPTINSESTIINAPSGPFLPAIPGPDIPATWNETTSFLGYNTKQGRYPDVKSDGFLELVLSSREHTNDLDKLDTIRNDEVYKKIPLDVVEGSTKFDMSYDIGLEGKLDDDLTIFYDIEKEPDFPGKYNLKIQKGNHELQFGDFESQFGAGEFIDVKKSLEGAKVESRNLSWNGKIATGKTKSEPQKLQTFGNGGRIYNLGKQYILEGSVTVYINNSKQTENTDFTINYFEGTVTFTKPITKVDFIKIIYEFTNPIQDFIPSLSRKSFTGAQFFYEPNEFFFTEKFITGTADEELITTHNPIKNGTHRFFLTHPHVVLGSETVYLNNERLTHKSDYFLKHRSGGITLQNLSVGPNDSLRVIYKYVKTKPIEEIQSGQNSQGPYYLGHKNIAPDSVVIKINGKPAQETVDYTIDYDEGKLYFNYKVQRVDTIEIEYTALLSVIVKHQPEESPLRVGITYLDESSSLRDDVVVERAGETPSLGDDNRTISTDFFPIEQSRPVVVTVSDVIVEVPSANIDYYRGIITLDAPAPNADSIKLDYFYRKSFTAEAQFKTQAGRNTYTVLEIDPPKLPIRFDGVSRVQMPDGTDLLEGAQRDYTVDYLDDGQDFVLTIITNQLESQLTSIPVDQTLKITYKFTPDSDLSQGKSQQQMFDLILDYEVNEKWKINTEYAYSYFDFSKNKKETSERILVSSSTVDQEYTLANKPVVIDTETIFLNGFPLSRDKDYFINYEQGTVRFRNLTLSSSDEVTIKYDYFENDKPDAQAANAYKVGTSYKVRDNVTIHSSAKFIEPNFRSIGELKDEPGTLAVNGGLLWNISSSDNISVDYNKRTRYNDVYDEVRDEREFITSANLIMLNLDTTHTFRFQELETTGDVTEKDFRLTAYENGIGFGPNHLRANITSLLSQKIESFKVEEERADSLITGYGTSLFYEPKKPLIVKNINFKPYYNHQSQSTERLIPTQDTVQLTDYYGIKSSTKIIQGLDNTGSFEKKTLSFGFPDIQIVDDYYNYSNITTYYPFSWFTTSYALDHEEEVSPIPGQRYRINDQQIFHINQLGLYSGLKFVHAPAYIYRRFSGANATALNSATKTLENNALKKYNQKRQYYTLSNFAPYSWFTLNSYGFETRNSDTKDRQTSSTQLRFDNTLDYVNADGKLTFTPQGRILELFEYKIDFENLDSNSNSKTVLASGTENRTERILTDDIQNHLITFKPGDFSLGNMQIKNPVMTFNHKKTNKSDLEETQSFSNNIALNNPRFILENQEVSGNTVTLGFTPFRIMDVDATYTDQKEYYNRNKAITVAGSLYKTFINREIKFGIDPYTKFQTDSYYRLNTLEQNENSTINVSIKELEGSDSEKKLNLKEDYYGTRLTFTPWSPISFVGAFDVMDITQRLTQNNDFNKEDFQQDKYTTGLIIRPLRDMSLGVDYSVKQLQQNQDEFTGYSSVATFLYNPLRFENFRLDVNISQTNSWGYGFNELERDSLLQTSGAIQNFSIRNRNDSVLLASIILSLDITLDNFRYLDKLVISGEAYVKRITDEVNPENEYEISGMLFKTSIML
ncbi:MAG: hypothetical protein O3A01_02575 [bacterium]|nr:hypothetical protein [bacterium]